MHIKDFDYTLPDSLIAAYPRETRGTTKLLCLDKHTGKIDHHVYSDILQLIQPGDVVVLNNTKVLRARLLAHDDTGKIHELLLLEKHGTVSTHSTFKALYRGKLHVGQALWIDTFCLHVQAIEGNGIAVIHTTVDILQIAEKHGTVPLPPYMKRDANELDIARYQTEFATNIGSVAAPTASLNFTNELKNNLEIKGISVVYITLHVGIGTFLPIRVDHLGEHKMHSEYFEIPKITVDTIQSAKKLHHNIIAVGTTVCRTLESNANHILSDQPHLLQGEADIFIYPGYKFQIVDALLTNFHAPKSTVLMMAAAFAGWDNLKSAYTTAINEQYKFLSYGDSMFIY